MDGQADFHSRMYFLCPICKKAPRTLPGHLRTVCMQGSSGEDIRDTVIKAKKEMAEFSHTGRFLEYKRICEILASADPLARCVSFIFCLTTLSCCSAIVNNLSNVCVFMVFLLLACYRRWRRRDWWWKIFPQSFLHHLHFATAPRGLLRAFLPHLHFATALWGVLRAFLGLRWLVTAPRGVLRAILNRRPHLTPAMRSTIRGKISHHLYFTSHYFSWTNTQ